MSDQVLPRLLEQVEGSHLSFIRFVGRISRHEWDWSPDEGIPSARDVVGELMRAEQRVLAKLGGGQARPGREATDDLATPSGAAASLRGLRGRTLVAVRHPVTPEAGIDAALQSAISLAQLDAHALGSLVILQRLIDPSRTPVSPR